MFDHFDILAPIYDRAIPFSHLEVMLKLADLPADGILLDAGGGTGRVAAALKSYVDITFVADPSRGMLIQSKKKGLLGVQSLAENLPFADGIFERIVMVDALHHVNRQESTISELWRVLKPGGKLVIEEPDIDTFQIKIVALVEKITLMRSHFLTPEKIAAIFPPDADVEIEKEGTNAWVIVSKNRGPAIC